MTPVSQVIEPAILAELWRIHARRLLVIARSIGEPAEDAVQEAFAALATQSQLPSDPLAWLVRACRNQLISWHRKRQSQYLHRDALAAERNWFIESQSDIENQLDGKQVTQWLSNLPADEREIIVMHLWGEMTFRQIAAATDYSPATAHRLFHCGLETLKTRAGRIQEKCHE